jgi:hypothetical protein
VKALFANPGLVRAVQYRPSIRTQLLARLARLDEAGRDGVEALAADPAAPLPAALGAAGQAAVLDAALDHLDLRFGRDLVVGKAPAAARVRQALLERRSALGVVSPPLDVPPPRDRAPQLGHRSARAGVGGGVSSRDGPLAILDLRLGLHDLGDPADGYPPLAQIEFFPARLRLAPREGRAEVDEAWLARVVSLTDLSRFELRPSWRMRLGVATVRDRGCAGCLAGQAELGAGFAEALGPLDLYAGADVLAEWAPRLAGLADTRVRLGVGPGGLARLRLGRRAALLADARWRWLPAATPRETFELRATLRLHLSRDLSLAVEGRRTPVADEVTAAILAFY